MIMMMMVVVISSIPVAIVESLISAVPVFHDWRLFRLHSFNSRELDILLRVPIFKFLLALFQKLFLLVG